jgi:hypothetical protein
MKIEKLQPDGEREQGARGALATSAEPADPDDLFETTPFRSANFTRSRPPWYDFGMRRHKLMQNPRHESGIWASCFGRCQSHIDDRTRCRFSYSTDDADTSGWRWQVDDPKWSVLTMENRLLFITLGNANHVDFSDAEGRPRY